MNYWLFKSEPDTFSVDDLGFFYHSSCEVPGIYGVVRVVRAGYPERAALDPKSRYFDDASDPANPRWYCVDVRLERKFEPPITLDTLRKHAHGALAEMIILRRGNRLSVTPVTAEEWRFILSLA